jgi:hypothetical protein
VEGVKFAKLRSARKMQAQKDDERTRAQSAAGSRTWDSRDNVQNEEGGSAYISDRARAAVAKLSDTKFCLSVRMTLEANRPGYHAEVSEPGAGSPTARRSFATLDGALDWVMWRKVDNPDLIGRLKRTIASLTIDKRWRVYITSVLLIGRNYLAPGFHGNTT